MLGQGVIVSNVQSSVMNYDIPNVFTPNGDEINDVFKLVDYQNVANATIVILNRWSNKVFENDKVDFQWNGSKYNDGTPCDDGVYFYKITFEDFSGKFSQLLDISICLEVNS